MKRLRELNAYRDKAWERALGSLGNDVGGCFKVKSESRQGTVLAVVASSAEGWDHVSVSTPLRCPNWAEMEQIKRLFFKEDEVAMQLHVKPDNHISVHNFCLHIWRPIYAQIPMPPSWMVA